VGVEHVPVEPKTNTVTRASQSFYQLRHKHQRQESFSRPIYTTLYTIPASQNIKQRCGPLQWVMWAKMLQAKRDACK